MTHSEVTAEDIIYLRAIRRRVAQEMFGLDPVINLLLISLLLRGHALLEGNPGLGKTALVKALSGAMGMGQVPLGGAAKKPWGRIQFTPDLMPSDITGTLLPDPNNPNRLVFKEGPVFSNILLADEINRATPKTQSAMLEAMAEDQVTVLGETHPLTTILTVRQELAAGTFDVKVRTPFFVIATQNPIEQEGTNPLPEAQLDRFFFKIRMPFPAREDLQTIVDKIAGPAGQGGPRADQDDDARTMLVRFAQLEAGLRAMQPAEPVQSHILNMVMASVGRFEAVRDVQGKRLTALKDFCAREVEMPLGPRAAAALTLGALGWSMLAIVQDTEPDQIPNRTTEALGQIVMPVLRHRMRFASVYSGVGGHEDQQSPDDTHDTLVREFARLTAPSVGNYPETIADAIAGAASAADL